MSDLALIVPRLLNLGQIELRYRIGSLRKIRRTYYGIEPCIKGAAHMGVTLDYWKEAPFRLIAKDEDDVMRGNLPMQASEAIRALGNIIEEKITTPGATLAICPLDVNTRKQPDSVLVTNCVNVPLWLEVSPDRSWWAFRILYGVISKSS